MGSDLDSAVRSVVIFVIICTLALGMFLGALAATLFYWFT